LRLGARSCAGNTGPTYREMLTWMAKEGGIDTRRTDNLVRSDRVRKGKQRF